MADRQREPSMERIRAHAREQVARTSLRKVATRAGVKVGATKKFIDGSEPYERNARMWKRWYARELREAIGADPDDALPLEDARIALDLLFMELGEDERDTAIARAAAAIRDVYRALGHTPPHWATQLAGEPGPG